MKIPFNKPYLTGHETEYLSRAVSALKLSGDGVFTRDCSNLLTGILGKESRVLLTTSCTHALEMAALLLDLQPGDEVIVPSFTFVSTVNAFVLRGARPVFIDIRPDTLNFDENRFEDLIQPRTRAAVPVHYGGVGCDMNAIVTTAARHGIAVVEDNAHGLCGTYRDRPLGTFGCLSTLSFHETKNFSCGEGGALVVNQPDLMARAEILRDKGTNRARFFRGEIDKYTWVDIGSSYLPSDILAAFLLAQLEQRERIQNRRREIWNRYHSRLDPLRASCGIQLPTIPPECGQAYHLFYMLTRTLDERTALIQHLKDRSMLAVFHYVPLHLSSMGRKFGGYPGQCPVTEDISERLLRLPFFNDLTDDEQDRVCDAIHEFYKPR